MNKLLEIRDLEVKFSSQGEQIYAVRDLSIVINRGEVLGIVGESGAGKSTIGNAIVNLLDPPGEITNGQIFFHGQNIVGFNDEQMSDIRGKKIGMIFQDPQVSLNPLMTIGRQLIETIINTTNLFGNSAFDRAIDLLNSVGIDQPKARFGSYPHQFSGGMRQRIVIALALAGNPDLIIADEPTSALDVSIQAQILDLIKKLCIEHRLSMLIITHDIGVIASIADRVLVMYRGAVVEKGNIHQIIRNPQHQYTQNLIAAIPPSDKKIRRFNSVDYIEGGSKTTHRINLKEHWLGEKLCQTISEPAIYIEGLTKVFTIKKAILARNRITHKAVNNVSFSIKCGESFGLVGESGSGKSTLARLIAGLIDIDHGILKLFGKEVSNTSFTKIGKTIRHDLEIIFQNPFSSLNPRMRIQDIIAEPIEYYKTAPNGAIRMKIVRDILEHVGLEANAIYKYPHEFSGGQRQRISIARALASRPKLLICDEPTSALDVSVQANVLNLLKDLQDELDLTMLFISHDLPVIRQMCDRIAVMSNGSICEIAKTDTLFSSPRHEYSKHLLSLMPKIEDFSDQN